MNILETWEGEKKHLKKLKKTQTRSCESNFCLPEEQKFQGLSLKSIKPKAKKSQEFQKKVKSV